MKQLSHRQEFKFGRKDDSAPAKRVSTREARQARAQARERVASDLLAAEFKTHQLR